MDTIEISGLEVQVEKLIHELKQLKAENISLRQQLAQDAKSRGVMDTKNQQASQKIKKIVRQLKESIS